MTGRDVTELLYDSEAALRLVDSAIEDIREPDNASESIDPARLKELKEMLAGANDPHGLIGVSRILARGYAEIVSVLANLRESRGVLERATVDKLQQTNAKLREVSNATEVAATDIMNGLERSLGVVDEMDAAAVQGDARTEADLRGKLRDELFALIGHLQFQDITTQQLAHAAAVITETENRLAELATVLGPAAFEFARASVTPRSNAAQPMTYDPAASTQNAEARQAVADEIFQKKEGR